MPLCLSRARGVRGAIYLKFALRITVPKTIHMYLCVGVELTPLRKRVSSCCTSAPGRRWQCDSKWLARYYTTLGIGMFIEYDIMKHATE